MIDEWSPAALKVWGVSSWSRGQRLHWRKVKHTMKPLRGGMEGLLDVINLFLKLSSFFNRWPAVPKSYCGKKQTKKTHLDLHCREDAPRHSAQGIVKTFFSIKYDRGAPDNALHYRNGRAAAADRASKRLCGYISASVDKCQPKCSGRQWEVFVRKGGTGMDPTLIWLMA